MRYRKPFTPLQRREVIREYKSFRNHLRLLRDDFPPITRVEREAFRRYRQCVKEIKAEMLKSDARVDVDELNAQIELARIAMAEYLRVKYFGE